MQGILQLIKDKSAEQGLSHFIVTLQDSNVVPII